MFESINPYYNYSITTSKEIHKKKNTLSAFDIMETELNPNENQYNQLCALNDPKSRYKANYILNILKTFIITIKLYIYWIKKIGPRMENRPMEKLLEHALSKSSNTHSDKMIRISIHF